MMQTIFSVLRRWFLLGCLTLLFILFYYFRLHQYLSFDVIQSYQLIIKEWTMLHAVLAVSLYLLFFILMIACGIPGASILTVVGGFLFGSIAIFYSILATTLGGLLLFLAIRTAFGASIAAKSSGWIKKMEHGFQKNAFNYLLSLRLMPIFPCWISNIAAGALNVPIPTFLIATLLGITPAAIIYVMAGQGLNQFFASGKTPDFNLLLTPSLFFPLLGLAMLSLFPVFYKGIKQYRQR